MRRDFSMKWHFIAIESGRIYKSHWHKQFMHLHEKPEHEIPAPFSSVQPQLLINTFLSAALPGCAPSQAEGTSPHHNPNTLKKNKVPANTWGDSLDDTGTSLQSAVDNSLRPAGLLSFYSSTVWLLLPQQSYSSSVSLPPSVSLFPRFSSAGTYLTHEAKGSDDAPDADTAIINAEGGHSGAEDKKEYFI